MTSVHGEHIHDSYGDREGLPQEVARPRHGPQGTFVKLDVSHEMESGRTRENESRHVSRFGHRLNSNCANYTYGP